jgi:hypothetical protein
MVIEEAIFTYSPITLGTVDRGHDTVSIGLTAIAFIEAAVCIIRPYLMLVLIEASIAEVVLAVYMEALFDTGLAVLGLTT